MKRWLVSTVEQAETLSLWIARRQEVYAFQDWYRLKNGISITSWKSAHSSSHCGSGVNSATSDLPRRTQCVTPASDIV